jgi:hypothetical protein
MAPKLLAYLHGVVDKLLASGSALDLITLMHVFQQLRSGSFRDPVLEIGADVCGAVRAILLAEVVKDQSGGLLRSELCLFLVFLGWRHVDGEQC